MSDLSYTPTFSHPPWTDNVSLVTGGGPDGFNIRFAAIESDLHQVSTVIAAIDAEIDAIGPGGVKRLNVPLDLKGPLARTPGSAWFCDGTGAMHPPATAVGGTGVMDLTLPDKAKLTSMRVTGLYPGQPARLSVSVARNSPFFEGQPRDILFELTDATPGLTNPYDLTLPVTDPALATVDLSTFRYFLVASASQVANSGAISVAAVQLFYTAG